MSSLSATLVGREKVIHVANEAALPVCISPSSPFFEERRFVDDPDQADPRLFHCFDDGTGVDWHEVLEGNGGGGVSAGTPFAENGVTVVDSSGDIVTDPALIFDLASKLLAILGDVFVGTASFAPPSTAQLFVSNGSGSPELVFNNATGSDTALNNAHIRVFNAGGPVLELGTTFGGTKKGPLRIGNQGVGLNVNPPDTGLHLRFAEANQRPLLIIETNSIGDASQRFAASNFSYAVGARKASAGGNFTVAGAVSDADLSAGVMLEITSAGDGVFTGSVTANGSTDLGNVSADPSAPSDGTKWYNTTDGKFRGRANGVTVDLH